MLKKLRCLLAATSSCQVFVSACVWECKASRLTRRALVVHTHLKCRCLIRCSKIARMRQRNGLISFRRIRSFDCHFALLAARFHADERASQRRFVFGCSTNLIKAHCASFRPIWDSSKKDESPRYPWSLISTHLPPIRSTHFFRYLSRYPITSLHFF